MLKFYWNGIKDNGGQLQLCYYCPDAPTADDVGEVAIYARNYGSFSAGICAVFDVRNDSDIVTDYFQKDSIRVTHSHPHYAAIVAAFRAGLAHSQRVADARQAKHPQIGGAA